MEGVLSPNTSENSEVQSSNEAANFADIKKKIVRKEYKICEKRGRSAVWNVFGKVESEAGVEISNVVECRTCWNVYKFNQNSTSNLVRHKCYKSMKENVPNIKTEVSADLKHAGTEILAQWAIANCRSFRMVEDSGLKNFSEFLISIGAKYGPHVNVDTLLPHPTTISRNVNRLYENTVAIVKKDMQFVNNMGYGLTSDIWTDNYIRTSYVSLTIHYVKDGKLAIRLLGLSSFKGERCTGKNIQQKVIKMLNEFDLSVGKAVFVTDRGSNMKKAFESYPNISCVNHLLNNTLEKSMKLISELDELCNAATKLVRFFKKSGENSGLTTSLKSFSPTRWNTIFYLLSSIKKSWTEITKVLEEKQQLSKISNINLGYLEELLQILEVFEESSKELEGEKYPTLHLVLPHINRLKQTCTLNDTDLSFIKEFKKKLSDLLSEVVLENITIFQKIAVFLLPPTNKLMLFDENDKHLIRNECKKLMSSNDNGTTHEDLQNTTENLPSTRKTQPFAAFLQPAQVLSDEDHVNNELIKYESTNVIYSDEFDVLHWWYFHRLEFHLLYKVACSVLTIPASSAASERVFSKARHLISEKRSAIGSNPVSVHQLMFLHYNMDINKQN